MKKRALTIALATVAFASSATASPDKLYITVKNNGWYVLYTSSYSENHLRYYHGANGSSHNTVSKDNKITYEYHTSKQHDASFSLRYECWETLRASFSFSELAGYANIDGGIPSNHIIIDNGGTCFTAYRVIWWGEPK